MVQKININFNIQKKNFDRFVLARKRRRPLNKNIKTPPAFHAILVKERARVDRNNHFFSLISVEALATDPEKDSIRYFAQCLNNKVRITDEVGWLDNNSIGVMLFNSVKTEAKQFIERIQSDCFPTSDYKYSISTYPKDKVKNSHSQEVHKERCACLHAMPDFTSLNSNHSGIDKKTAKELYPFFFDKEPLWKRVLDVILSIVALIALSPLFLVIGLAVKLTSKGPILFKQQRAGLGGRPFTFLKFRTMKIDAEGMKSRLLRFNERTGPVFKMKNDPRITWLGKFLRKWSLDELPQFINVLKGDMSLVGPRPPTMDEVEEYSTWHNYRLEMKPGITCIWQIYARQDKSFENWVRLDIKYQKERSVLLDMKLLLMTLPAVLARKGAC